ncbi:glycosyltransferase family 4 protein [Paenisporosarcina sp. NPDC076898]|uniref:glycosyltransferase family 4 protein n=1 Tax=unclassified Paenisporosarcina TaxID=2642018 RepID=UPI003D0089FB
MKKILIVTTVQQTISAFLIPHIIRLKEQGFEVEIATRIENKAKLEQEVLGIHSHNVSFNRNLLSIDNIKSIFSMWILLKNKSYDILHVHTPIASFISRLVAPKSTKLIYTAHGFHFNENGKKFTNFCFFLAEKLAALKTNQIIVINRDDLKVAQKMFKESKVNYIEGVGVNTDKYTPKQLSTEEKNNLKSNLNIPNEYKIISHIAEFNGNKRQIDIVNACELIKKEYEKFTILLVGDGLNFDSIKGEIKLKGLEDNIICLGYQKNIPEILSITDIGLLVSLREGLPRSVMEMMSMEIPVILSDIRGNKDLVIDGYNGFLVPVKSPDKIAENCLKLLKDQELSIELGEKSRKLVLEKYSLYKVLKKMDLIYQKF